MYMYNREKTTNKRRKQTKKSCQYICYTSVASSVVFSSK